MPSSVNSVQVIARANIYYISKLTLFAKRRLIWLLFTSRFIKSGLATYRFCPVDTLGTVINLNKFAETSAIRVTVKCHLQYQINSTSFGSQSGGYHPLTALTGSSRDFLTSPVSTSCLYVEFSTNLLTQNPTNTAPQDLPVEQILTGKHGTGGGPASPSPLQLWPRHRAASAEKNWQAMAHGGIDGGALGGSAAGLALGESENCCRRPKRRRCCWWRPLILSPWQRSGGASSSPLLQSPEAAAGVDEDLAAILFSPTSCIGYRQCVWSPAERPDWSGGGQACRPPLSLAAIAMRV
jgi:hypothetical protein